MKPDTLRHRDAFRLTLFMSRGSSLGLWVREGLFEREVALYRRLQVRGAEVGFISYGGPEEREYASRLPGMRILCNRWQLPDRMYERLVPWLHASWLWRSHILKTNQIAGSAPARRAARLWRKPLVARCGFLLSDFLAYSEGRQANSTRAALELEADVFTAARRVVVTSRAMAEVVAARIVGGRAKTKVIPNYVDTELFRPVDGVKKDIDVLFVGRIAAQKNIESLLEAVAPLDLSMTMVGDGPERKLVEEARSKGNGRLRWLSRVGNDEIPQLMSRTRVFVLPSLWEGHPKTLIEAMACGLPVVGGNAPGIANSINHGIDGWLCDTNATGIRNAITHLLAHPDLCRELGRNAWKRATTQFSLDLIAEKEWALLWNLAQECAGIDAGDSPKSISERS